MGGARGRTDVTDERALTARGRRTAERLVEAARTVVAERGYAAARVEDVTALAGVAHGTFYTYFENKAAVFAALLARTERALLEVADAPWEGPDPETALTDVLDRFLAVFADHADVLTAWREAAAHEPTFDRRWRGLRAGFTGRVAQQVSAPLAATPHDPHVVASALVALVEGYAFEYGHGDDGARRRQALATLTRLWTGGLRALLDR